MAKDYLGLRRSQNDMIFMEITHNEGRFSMKTGHGEAELLYKMDGKIMSIYHTFVPEEDRGRGLAEKLAYSAFNFAKEKGMKVRPDCSYIVHFLEVNKEMKRYAVD